MTIAVSFSTRLFVNCVIDIWLLIIRLRMSIDIFIDTTKGLEPRYRVTSPFKYYNRYSTLDIYYIFKYYAHFIHFCTFKFLINS